MFCGYCGTRIVCDGVYCPECGKRARIPTKRMNARAYRPIVPPAYIPDVFLSAKENTGNDPYLQLHQHLLQKKLETKYRNRVEISR